MSTLAELRAQWIINNPFPLKDDDGTSDGHLTTQGEYDTRADDRAAILFKQQAQEEADAARIALRKKYLVWQTHKASWATEFAQAAPTTLAQTITRLQATRTAFNVLVGDMDALIEVLKDAGMLLDDTP